MSVWIRVRAGRSATALAPFAVLLLFVEGCSDAPSVTIPSCRDCIVLASHQCAQNGIAVTSANVYWTTYVSNLCESVYGIAKTGGLPSTVGWSYNPQGIAADNSGLYWANGEPSGSILMAGDGGPGRTLVSGLVEPTALAIDAVNVYWIDHGNGGSRTTSVMQISRTGGAPIALASNLLNPVAIAVDFENVYWVDGGTYYQYQYNNFPYDTVRSDGAVYQVPIGGGTVIQLASEQAGPIGVQTDGTSVFWSTMGNVDSNYVGQVQRAPVGGGMSTSLASGRDIGGGWRSIPPTSTG